MRATEKTVVWLLGALLACVGWQAQHGREPWPPSTARPDFDFLNEFNGGQTVGGGEYWFRAESFVMIDGVAGVEKLQGSPFRHGLGPVTRLIMRTPEDVTRTAVLTLRFFSGVPNQNLVMRYDGKPLETLQNLPLDTVERTYRLPLGPGEHEFRMEYERWNHHGIELTAEDGRTMAVTFSRLELTFQQ